MNANKLRGKVVESGLSMGELAAKIGIDRSSLYRKIKERSFTVREASLISKELKLTKDDVMSIFFNDYVA